MFPWVFQYRRYTQNMHFVPFRVHSVYVAFFAASSLRRWSISMVTYTCRPYTYWSILSQGNAIVNVSFFNLSMVLFCACDCSRSIAHWLPSRRKTAPNPLKSLHWFPVRYRIVYMKQELWQD